MRTQAEKAAIFQELHRRPGAFIIPNPWDPGTARLLASLGFEALATTSLGLANSWGRGTVSADEIIDNARMIAAATDLPTNGDLENCGADEPEEAAQMIRRASDTIRTVVSSVSKPINVVMTHADPSITAAQLAEIGVKRISIGGSGSRFALNAFMSAAREMAERGTFTFVGENPPWKDLLDGFAKGKG